jgi:hypothetical protein
MSKILTSLVVLASVSSVCSAARSEDAAEPYAFDRGYPTPEASQRARDDADFQRAIVAYRFWYPAVSVEGIFNGNRAIGLEDNKGMGAAAAGPRQVGFTLNSDTPYGSATLDLSNGPMVIEIPPGPYIGLVDDHYQGWVLDMEFLARWGQWRQALDRAAELQRRLPAGLFRRPRAVQLAKADLPCICPAPL